MKAAVYLLKCLTNMHVGNGEESYNIIDNEVEKDVVTGNPAIYSSGVKGSILQYFKTQKSINKNTIEFIFGNEYGGTEVKEGNFKFLEAQMLARPMRVSDGDVSFAMVTTNEILQSFAEHLETFGFNKDELVTLKTDVEGERFIVGKESKIKEIEGYSAEESHDMPVLSSELGLRTNLAVTSASNFRNIDLPVLARNCLKNGKSKNLWYEQIVPHESLFYLTVLYPDDSEYFETFNSAIDGKIVQFGGNASIGYGYTKVLRLRGDLSE
ncbi:type III-B CRISPR module RAMP protein Cmr4 [Anaerostipes sp.]|uniref:type III-B CRISPR module RAMP protein Cmr4 n=1 Tax=Anaerostipes sp. TaxID=1872530 RepID=UPI0025C1F052|nr:type III-B CRISPR module RAMP protein Cmr4 [Anaerostipes sp.]MBS7007938.1 type III-B CRISPR module RAMP protein Cmr4 [Anaerostipes sp.]